MDWRDIDYNIVADRMLTDYEGLDKWFKPEVTMKLNIKPIEGLSYSQTLSHENSQWELHQFRSRYHRDEDKTTVAVGLNLSSQRLSTLHLRVTSHI